MIRSKNTYNVDQAQFAGIANFIETLPMTGSVTQDRAANSRDAASAQRLNDYIVAYLDSRTPHVRQIAQP